MTGTSALCDITITLCPEFGLLVLHKLPIKWTKQIDFSFLLFGELWSGDFWYLVCSCPMRCWFKMLDCFFPPKGRELRNWLKEPYEDQFLDLINFGNPLLTITKVGLVKQLLVWAVQAWQNRSFSHLSWRGCFGSRPLRSQHCLKHIKKKKKSTEALLW